MRCGSGLARQDNPRSLPRHVVVYGGGTGRCVLPSCTVLSLAFSLAFRWPFAGLSLSFRWPFADHLPFIAALRQKATGHCRGPVRPVARDGTRHCLSLLFHWLFTAISPPFHAFPLTFYGLSLIFHCRFHCLAMLSHCRFTAFPCISSAVFTSCDPLGVPGGGRRDIDVGAPRPVRPPCALAVSPRFSCR